MPKGVYLRTKDPWNKGLSKVQYPQLSRIAWNKGLTKETDARLIEMGVKGAISRKGREPWDKGLQTGPRSEDTKKKIGASHKRLWGDPAYAKMKAEQLLEGNKNARPNKPEKEVIGILKSLSSDIKYVGDGKYWIPGIRMNPDFINEDKKQIIEVFGCFWHCCKKCGHQNRDNQRRKDASRITEFRKLGYLVLVIWEHELKNHIRVIKKMVEFHV